MKLKHLFFLTLPFASITYAQDTIKVTFVVASNAPDVAKYDQKKYMQNQINTLNQYFRDGNGKKIFNFKLQQYISYQEFTQMKCHFQKMINQPREFVVSELAPAVNQCFKHRADHEVLFFLYDAYSDRHQYKEATSWGFPNQSKPFIMIDWSRFDLKQQSVSIHEMGHALGLKHVCASGGKKTDSSNIMTSSGCGFGSMGKRDLGFNKEQVTKMVKNYKKSVKAK